jgi:hypothetical protein
MMREDQTIASENEPTIWDWVKSLFKLKPIPIPDPKEVVKPIDAVSPQVEPEPILEEFKPEIELDIKSEAVRISAKHLRLPLALFWAMLAQFLLESRHGNIIIAVVIYIFAALIVGWAAWEGDFNVPFPVNRVVNPSQVKVRIPYLAAGVVLMIFTFFTSRGNRYTLFNLIPWIGSLVSLLIAFWEGDPPFWKLWLRVKTFWQDKKLDFQIKPWHILITASAILILFFRVTQIERVPYEMWSDHAEKLWDVMDVLNGQYSIFFPRNTGREPIQFYMAAAVIKLLDTGISFTTLKITSILAGLLTLPYLYLFAKEIGGKYVGLAAMLLAGIAYWPNVISRLGLRFPLYPLFVAPALYYLLRGIRLRRRNDFILCGLAIGLGLNGYSPARVIPLAILVGVLIFLASKVSKEKHREVIIWFLISSLIALVVFIPLLAAISTPGMTQIFLDRMVSRMSSTEQPLPDSPLKLLVENLWRGLRMFAWDDGEIWVVSIPFRPALDWVTGALFHLGVIIVIIRFLRTRRWQDLYLLLLIPILMLPSILSLAFPGENPALNRASGAIIPVFTIAAIPLVMLPKWAKETFKSMIAHWAAISFSIILFLNAAFLNYSLVFKEFVEQHRQNTWNASEIAAAIRGFAETIGSYETAHIVRKSYWVDTRLVSIQAGDPGNDNAFWPSELETIPPETYRPQLFIVKPDDEEGLEKLRELYPYGVAKLEKSAVIGRDFILYYVFPQEGIDLDTLLPEP